MAACKKQYDDDIALERHKWESQFESLNSERQKLESKNQKMQSALDSRGKSDA